MLTRFGHVTRLAVVCALSASMGVLFLASPLALAQDKAKEQASTPIAQDITKKAHRLVLQVNTSEPATMNLALNNAHPAALSRAPGQRPRRLGDASLEEQ
jgi:hypothetical protein